MDTPPTRTPATLVSISELAGIDPNIVASALIVAMDTTRYPITVTDDLDHCMFALGFMAGKLYSEHGEPTYG